MIYFSGCTEKYKKEIEQLNATTDSLKAVGESKDAFAMEYVRSFNAIQANLDSIKKMEKIISDQTDASNPEMRKLNEDNINRDIDAIYQLLLKNKQIVDRLKNQLNSSGQKNSELEQMIVNLSEQIRTKDLELTALKADLSRKNLQIKDLEANLEAMEALNRQRAAEIEAKINEMNTVYYITGTKKILEEKGIIISEGGLLGIGKTQKLVNNPDLSLFTKGDLREISALPVFSKKAELISIHPAESYQYLQGDEKQIDSLKILHPDDFWSSSKFLVMMIN
jgi:DNA repair exonuclease SbcCD ATPase subunit